MQNNPPLVSIGFAVYNGEPYLTQALDSILGQTFTDFELIISDNASSDGTEKICKQYSAKDQRIRYYRNSKNIGGANNHNQTFRLARGTYFRWAAHDDVCAPELITECVAVLDRDPTIVLCYSMLTEINEAGEAIKTVSQQRGLAAQPHQRFRELASREHNCEATYGLVRSAVLAKTRLQQNYTDADRTLLCELGLHGRFYEIPELLFYKRYHPKNMYKDWRARMAWFDPWFKGKPVFPYWMQFFDYLNTIRRVPISRREKSLCYAYMFYWLAINGKRMAKDVFVAFLMMAHLAGSPDRNKDLYNWE